MGVQQRPLASRSVALLRIKPNIDVGANNECAFLYTCFNGHLRVAQWLLRVKPDIDVGTDNELAFRLACCYGRLRTAQWLLRVKPDICVRVAV